jgi:hypothetical protein
MAIDDGLDETGDSSGGGEVTDLGGETGTGSDDSGGGEADSEVAELDPDTEHDNAMEAHGAVLTEVDGERDEPDPGGDADPKSPDVVELEEEEPTSARVADLQGEWVGVDEQHAEVQASMAEMGQVGEATTLQEPDKPVAEEPTLGAAATFGLAAAGAGKMLGDKWSEWRSAKDEGDQGPADQGPADQGAADDPDDEDRPRS